MTVASRMPKADKNKVAPDAVADDRSQVSGSTFDDRSRDLKDEAGDGRAAATQPTGTHLFHEQTDDDFVEELEGMGLTCNHARVLLLIGSFARAARHSEEKEGWIRQVPLIIMMYEGITQVLHSFTPSLLHSFTLSSLLTPSLLHSFTPSLTPSLLHSFTPSLLRGCWTSTTRPTALWSARTIIGKSRVNCQHHNSPHTVFSQLPLMDECHARREIRCG